MTREEFEAAYAAGCGTNVAFLRSLGRMAVPCDCNNPGCYGWEMLHVGTFLPDEEEMAAIPEPFRSELRWLHFRVSWRTRILYRWHILVTILRYLVTGYCGYGGCGYATFYRYWEDCRRCVRRDMCQYSGERVRPFVPEAGCPVHDADTWLSRWLRKVRKRREQTPWRVVATTWQLTETKKEMTK